MESKHFVHSVKVPQLYKSASKIVKTVFEEGGSIKQLLYNKVRSNLKSTYALITKTIENNDLLDEILKETELLNENKQLDVWLAKVLVTELLLGKGSLGGTSKPVLTIQQYSRKLGLALAKCNIKSNRQETGLKPRYVRVNTLKKTTDEVIKLFRQEGWVLLPVPESYYDFLSVVSNLTEEQFLRDLHVKDLLVFAAGSEFYRNPLYLDGTIILQDKASCIPPLLLKPEPGSTVIDMCSAPGMKTTMLSAMTRGKGKLYAVELNERRYQELQKFVEKCGCSNVHVVLHDALNLSEEVAPWIKDVEYILLDPSCSGTGMTDRAHLFTRPVTEEEIRRLAAFQRRLLTYALTNFPSARRLVYSTCSLQKEENEEVVEAVMRNESISVAWKVVEAFPDWPSRGSECHSSGPLCITANPLKDLTTGFFMAIFEKIEKEEVKSVLDVNVREKVKKKKKKDLDNSLNFKAEMDEEVQDYSNQPRKKKKRKKNDEDQPRNQIVVENGDEVMHDEKQRIKHKKRRKEPLDIEVNEQITDYNYPVKKKKKKKDK